MSHRHLHQMHASSCNQAWHSTNVHQHSFVLRVCKPHHSWKAKPAASKAVKNPCPDSASDGGGGSGGGPVVPPPPGRGRPGQGGSDDPQQPRSHWSIRRTLAVAAGSYMLLSLTQPWRWLSGLASIDTASSSVSIIIPVLNEAGSILATLQHLRQLQPPAAELIVVDGGSTDGTARLVRQSRLADKIISTGKGRAVQMNAGAAAAKGDLLCFLHADTQPPADLVSVMRSEMRDPHTVLAGFVPSIEVPKRRLWLLSFHNFISTYYAPMLFRPLSYLRGLRNLFGDQTMFCRHCDFKAVGGFDARWPIMEDTDLCVRMHDAGPCTHHTNSAPPPAHPSPHKHPSKTTSTRQLRPPLAGGALAGTSSAQHRLRQQMQQQHAAEQVAGQAEAPGVWQQWQQWQRPRGRVKQVLNRVSVTSGRRLDAWGPVKATYIHLVIGTSWYFTRDPAQLKQLYNKLYTDAFR